MSRSTETLLEALKRVELPTLGHFLEEGFCEQDLRPVTSGPQLVGRARTLDLTQPDAFAVNRALLVLEPGDVLVIRVAGRGHAPVGAVTAHAAIAQGAAGIVVDGPVTDQAALRELQDQLPVFATGLTARTTKRSGALANEPDGALDRTIEIGRGSSCGRAISCSATPRASSSSRRRGPATTCSTLRSPRTPRSLRSSRASPRGSRSRRSSRPSNGSVGPGEPRSGTRPT